MENGAGDILKQILADGTLAINGVLNMAAQAASLVEKSSDIGVTDAVTSRCLKYISLNKFPLTHRIREWDKLHT
jgi:hypothetical protein